MHTEYNPLEAASVAHANLPTEVRHQLTFEDVLYVLYQEFQYHETIHDISPPTTTLNQSQIERIIVYIQEAALQAGRSYSTEQIAYVLKGEDIYLRQIGLLDA